MLYAYRTLVLLQGLNIITVSHQASLNTKYMCKQGWVPGVECLLNYKSD